MGDITHGLVRYHMASPPHPSPEPQMGSTTVFTELQDASAGLDGSLRWSEPRQQFYMTDDLPVKCQWRERSRAGLIKGGRFNYLHLRLEVSIGDYPPATEDSMQIRVQASSCVRLHAAPFLPSPSKIRFKVSTLRIC